MNEWDLGSLDVQPRRPEILSTTDDARAILVNLPAGEALQDHEVHERAWITVVSGAVEMSTPEGAHVTTSGPHLFEFDPGERHEVTATSDARLLLLLTPWPGAGHPGAMSLEDKREVRERAAERARDSGSA